MATAHDLAQLAALLVFEYFDRNGQKTPLRIEMSVDVLCILRHYRQGGFKIEASSAGYRFQGVPIISKPDQLFLSFFGRKVKPRKATARVM